LESHKSQLQLPDQSTLPSESLNSEQPVPASLPASESPTEEGETTPKAAVEEATPSFPAVDPSPSEEPKTMHVLIVDDNEINVKVREERIANLKSSFEMLTLNQ
jgi:hypothetical protein